MSPEQVAAIHVQTSTPILTIDRRFVTAALMLVGLLASMVTQMRMWLSSVDEHRHMIGEG